MKKKKIDKLIELLIEDVTMTSECCHCESCRNRARITLKLANEIKMTARNKGGEL